MRLRILALLAAATACGDSGEGTCGFADQYLPYEVGYSWTYTVTDLADGERRVKRQRLEAAPDHPDYGPVILQVTEKTTGTTHSLLRRNGGRVERFEQVDLDLAGNPERTITYDPPRIRIDESDDRIAEGATFTEAYTETTTDEFGSIAVDVVDEWQVLGVDVPCKSPRGEFDCLEVRRLRTLGGNSDKTFFFARGTGKVREVGTNTLEDLADCE